MSKRTPDEMPEFGVYSTSAISTSYGVFESMEVLKAFAVQYPQDITGYKDAKILRFEFDSYHGAIMVYTRCEVGDGCEHTWDQLDFHWRNVRRAIAEQGVYIGTDGKRITELPERPDVDNVITNPVDCEQEEWLELSTTSIDVWRLDN
jgi:hypothetical protein